MVVSLFPTSAFLCVMVKQINNKNNSPLSFLVMFEIMIPSSLSFLRCLVINLKFVVVLCRPLQCFQFFVILSHSLRCLVGS